MNMNTIRPKVSIPTRWKFVAPLGILALLGLFGLASCGQTIQPGNVGVKIRTLGPSAGVDPVPLRSGWHINLPGERIAEFPAIQRTYTYTRE